jgi:hypothetical protein
MAQAPRLGECLLWEAPITGADARRQDVPFCGSAPLAGAPPTLGGPRGGGATVHSHGDGDARLVVWRASGCVLEVQESSVGGAAYAHTPARGCRFHFESPLLGGPLHCLLPDARLLLVVFTTDGGAHSLVLTGGLSQDEPVHSADLGPSLARLGRCVAPSLPALSRAVATWQLATRARGKRDSSKRRPASL